MGARILQCDHCDKQSPIYNSCRDRHCPLCQGHERAVWLDKRCRELLPVEYFHTVFTVPRELAPIAIAHPRKFYNLLFQASRETLLTVAEDPRHLGARIGGHMILHTWGQNLHSHPHVHVIIPGGGLPPDGQRWISCRRGFFLPVRVLSRVFRGKLLEYLGVSYRAGELPMTGGLADFSDPRRFQALLRRAGHVDWVVHVTPPAGDPKRVLKYLARYTHRVAIANSRIQSINDGKVSFLYKDYSQGGRQRSMTLDANEFLRRFFLHVLPKGFVRIRSFGILANCHRKAMLARCRDLLQAETPAAETVDPSHDEPPRCPHCHIGTLRLVRKEPRPRVPELIAWTYTLKYNDSS